MNKTMTGMIAALVGMAAFGDAVPTAYVSETGRDIVADKASVTLDAAYCFDAWPGGAKPDDATRIATYAQWGAYTNWNADFIVTFDRAVAANTVALFGQTDMVGAEWISMPIGDPVAKGTEIGMLAQLGVSTFPYVGVAELVSRFRCGVKNLSKANVGTTMCIELRISDPDSAATKALLKVSHTFRRAWFDARIAEYESWPGDAAKAVGGAWDAGAAALADVTGVGKAGTLDVFTKGTVTFQADVAKTVAGDVGNVVIASEVDFSRRGFDELPPIESDWKCGATVIIEKNGATNYYGLAMCGTTNGWVKLEGPAPIGGTVPARMTLRRVNGQTVVNYAINGSVYSYGTKWDSRTRQHVPVTDIPVAANGTVTGVAYGGCGSVDSLSAEAGKLGSAVFVK